jgi:hypothetical protein
MTRKTILFSCCYLTSSKKYIKINNHTLQKSQKQNLPLVPKSPSPSHFTTDGQSIHLGVEPPARSITIFFMCRDYYNNIKLRAPSLMRGRSVIHQSSCQLSHIFKHSFQSIFHKIYVLYKAPVSPGFGK